MLLLGLLWLMLGIGADLGGKEVTACLCRLASVAMSLIRWRGIVCEMAEIMRVLRRSWEGCCRVLLRAIMAIKNDTSLILRSCRCMIGRLNTIIVFRDVTTTLSVVTLRSLTLRQLLFRTAHLLGVFKHLRVRYPCDR